MKYNIYATYDKLTKLAGAPYLAVNDETAKRMYEDQRFRDPITKKLLDKEYIQKVKTEETVLKVGVFNPNVTKMTGVGERLVEPIITEDEGDPYDIYDVPVGTKPTNREE